MGRRLLVIGAVALVALAGCSAPAGPTGPPEPAVQPVEFPADAAPVPEAGATLAFGDVVTLPLATPAGATVEVTVIDIIKGSLNDDDALKEDPEFEGYTPYYVVTQFRWPSSRDQADPLLAPMLDDGDDSLTVEWEQFGGTDFACPLELPEPISPTERVDCILAVAPEGTAVVGVRWYNTSKFQIFEPDPTENPYYANPVVWGA